MAALDAPLFRSLPVRQAMEVMGEQQRRRAIDELYKSYVALIIPMWGGKDTPTWDEQLDTYKRRTHVTTQAELERAEDVGRSTAEAFGLL